MNLQAPKPRKKQIDELKVKTLQLKSDLPIMGAVFSEASAGGEVMVEAMLNDSAKPLYKKELTKITDQIAVNLKNSEKNISRSAKVELYQSILSQIDQYYKMRIVAQFLDCTAIPDCPVTTADIQGRLLELEKKADTLDFGARILSKNFKGEKLFIYPPKPTQYSKITQFGRVVKDHLAAQLKTSNHPYLYIHESWPIKFRTTALSHQSFF